VIVCVPVAVGVNVAEQLRFPLTTLHVVLPKVPPRLLENVTVPLGVDFVPVALSETVAVHVVLLGLPPMIAAVGEQLTLVDVLRFVTIRGVLPLLPANWGVSVPPP
jgi:hypothetical protein